MFFYFIRHLMQPAKLIMNVIICFLSSDIDWIDINPSGQQVQRTYHVTEEAFGFSTDSTSPISLTNISSKKPLGKLPINGHRRELVWKFDNKKNSSLEDILTS